MRPISFLCLLAAFARVAAALSIAIDTGSVLGSVPKLALGWEMWVMFGYYHDMADPAFINAFAGLGGATVRVGGITADFTTYAMDVNDDSLAAAPARALAASPRGPFWPAAPQNFTAGNLRTLLGFFEAANLSAVFDLAEFYGRNCSTLAPAAFSCYVETEWCEGAWDISNVKSFLQYLHDNSLVGPTRTLRAFELGNELACHIAPATNIADIRTLAAIIQEVWADVPAAQRPNFFAPSTDQCSPAQIEILNNLSSIPGVTGFSFHCACMCVCSGSRPLPP